MGVGGDKERGDEWREEGGGAVDATQSELSVMNKPRCLRDKANESGCTCKILSSPLPSRIDTQHCPIFLDQTLPEPRRRFTFVPRLPCIGGGELYPCVVFTSSERHLNTPRGVLSSRFVLSSAASVQGGGR